MNYLSHNEITEKSVIMIDFEEACPKPYFVSRISPGSVTGGTMLLGYLLEDMVLKPDLYPPKKGNEDRYYTSSDEHPDGGNVGVSGYRNLTEEERISWLGIVMTVPELDELVPLLM